MRPLAPLLLLALALLPLALPTAHAATCRAFDASLGDLGGLHAEAGSTCLGAEATLCDPDADPEEGCARVDAADLWPCIFCPGPVLW